MNYLELKAKHQREFNQWTEGKLYFIFEFSEEATAKKLAEYGVKPEEIVGIASGTYVKKEYYTDLLKITNEMFKEEHDYILNNLNESLVYEFANHELEINLDYSYFSFLEEVLGFTEEEIEANKPEILKAIEDYKEEFYKNN